MIFCYLRVSSALQAAANGVEMQRAEIQSWLAKHAPGAVHEFIEDNGVSGKTTDRAGWKMLRERVRDGDTVVVYSFTRASRSLADLSGWVKEMVARNVRIVSLKEQVDVSTATGRLMVNLIGSIGEWEREMTGERSSDGIKAAIASGRKWGAATKIKKGKPGYQQLTDEEWEKARAMLEAGESFTSVAKAAGISRSGLHYRWKKHQQTLTKEAA